jgi:hypothetical protein
MENKNMFVTQYVTNENSLYFWPLVLRGNHYIGRLNTNVCVHFIL